jgi:uncharacterized protein
MLFSISNNRVLLLERPEAYLECVAGRDLDAAEYAAQMPWWQKWLNAWDLPELADSLHESIEAYTEVRRHGVLEHPGEVSRTLAILLAEAGRIEEAKQELATTGDDRADPHFNVAFAQAYFDRATTNRPASSRVLPTIAPAWAQNKLELRLAEKRGDRLLAEQIGSRMVSRGRTVQAWATVISGVTLAFMCAGVIAAVQWFRRRPTGLRLGEGLSISPWRCRDGYAVLVRGAVGGMILAGGLSMLSERLVLVTGFITLLAGLPLFWLSQKYLLEPHTQTLSSSFGLSLARSCRGQLARVSLITLGLMLTGEAAISVLTAFFEQTSLPEVVPEEFLFGRWPQVMLSAMDAVVWAPLVEELAFRGMLYTTLRRRLSTLWAGLASSVIFALVHGYSLQGFLIILWSGFLWSMAYEKSRSLWPGMICHAVSNALAVGTPILMYRL